MIIVATSVVLHHHDPELSPQAGQHTQHVSLMMMVATSVVLHHHNPQLSPRAGQHTQHVSIIIMVTSSVVCTIMILNYHHRLANTHSM
jgi:hypothetical protein